MSGVILLMTSPIDRPVSLRRGPHFTLAVLLAALFVSGGAGAAEQTARLFNLSADTAAKALRRFTEQSGIPVLFGTETAAQVRTNAVQGEFTPDEAMARYLAARRGADIEARTTHDLREAARMRARKP